MSKIKININRLQVGLYVELPVGWHDHPFLFNRFLIKDDKQLALLHQMQLPYVLIHPDKSKSKPLPPEQPPKSFSTNEVDELQALEEQLHEEKQQSIDQMQEYRRNLKSCEDQFQRSVSKVRALVQKLPTRPLEALSEADTLIGTLTEALLATEDLVLHLVGDSRDNEDIYLHGLNVSVLAMMVGKAHGMDAKQVHQLGMAGLLHDVGKLKLPRQVFTPGNIPEQKRKHLIEKHPEYSLEFMRLVPDIDEEIMTMVAQHHEYADGSGYPGGLKADKLHPLTLAIALVNFYDNLCHPSNDRKAMPPSVALSYIFKKRKYLFDARDVAQLVKTLGVYPPGTVVRLSDEQIGMVISVNCEKLLYPNVLLYDEKVPRHKAPIINLEREELKIDTVVNAGALPEEVFEYLNPRTRVNYFFEQK